jgi:hypothetical protein
VICSGEREAHRQVEQRVANERVAEAARPRPNRLTLRCECGDAGCRGRLTASCAEYEAVRAHGSRFLILQTHENAETSIVVSAHAGFDVIESLGGEPRRIVLRGNPRDDWPRRR